MAAGGGGAQTETGDASEVQVVPNVDPNGCPFEIERDELLFEGRWLGARQLTYRDPANPSGTQRIWQWAYRTSTPRNSSVDAAVVIATLLKNDGREKYFVFVKQYRIPLSGWSLEFPAGLVDEGETVEACGVRELKEETGYTCTRVLSQSRGQQTLDPGLSNSTVNFVRVEIDGDLAENHQPKQQTDDGEVIEVVLLPADGLLNHIDAIASSADVRVEAIVYTFALGYTFNAN